MAGRGRPEIGGVVTVRLGSLKDEVDAWAKEQGVKQAEAIRMLIEIGLNRTSVRKRKSTGTTTP
jgi:hypothetical protein